MKIEIGRVQRSKPFLFADAIEIIAAFEGGLVSRTSAESLANGSVTSADEAMNSDEPDLDDNGYPDDLGGVEINARVQGQVSECWRQLEYRVAEFGDSYPFKFSPEGLRLRDDLSGLHYAYLALLISSRIRTFKPESEAEKGYKQSVADLFEILCRDVLAHMMHPSSEVIMFGPSTNDRKTKFHSDLRKAIPMLSDFMGADLTSNWDKNLSSSGDGGIDLVGVQKLDEDDKGAWNVYVGQCAAYEEANEWKNKRGQATGQFLSGTFHYLVFPQGVLFVPVCYHGPDGKWISPREIAGVITMDRVRIMRLLHEIDPSIQTSTDFVSSLKPAVA